MRHGMTIVPAGLVLVVTLLGAGGGPGGPPADGVAVLDERYGMRIAPIYLLLRPDVQHDLQLNPRQIASAKDVVARLIERGLRLKNKAGAAVLAERRAIDEEMSAWLRRELAEGQLLRLTQINFQWEGASALRRPVVAEYLALSERQRFKVERLLAERDKVERLLTERDRKRSSASLAQGEFDKLSRQALDVLTPLQNAEWSELLGPPCRFSVGRLAGPPTNAAVGPGIKGQPQPPG
jgi:hypothetical protein